MTFVLVVLISVNPMTKCLIFYSILLFIILMNLYSDISLVIIIMW